MASVRGGPGSRAVRTLFEVGAVGGLGDRELLDAFLRGEGTAAELAFEALVDRHGPMVAGVCRRILKDHQAAEDAFQATFLILASKANSLRFEASLGGWLHGVGRRVAVRARKAALRESPGTSRRVEPTVEADDRLERDEALRALDEEVARLPGRYRSALILCHLQGRTHDRAAEELGCPVGTVRSRLSRARDLLRSRLTRRGLAPGAVALGFGLESNPAIAAAPLGWVEDAARMAVGRGLAPAAATALCRGVLRSIAMTRWIQWGAAGLAVALGGIGASALVRGQDPADKPKPAAVAKDAATPAPAPARAKTIKERLAELEARQSVAWDAFIKSNRAAKTNAEREEAQRLHPYPKTVEYGRQFLALADEDPTGAVAPEALYDAFASVGHPGWIVEGNDEAYRERLAQLAFADSIIDRFLPFVARPEMANYCQQIALNGSLRTEVLLREVMAKNPDRTARGIACQGLANLLGSYATFGPSLADPEKTKMVEKTHGKTFVEVLRKRDLKTIDEEAEELHERVLSEFADVKVYPAYPEDKQTLAKGSELWLGSRRTIIVGNPAPAIEGQDIDGHPLKLADYRGKVVVLVFWGSWCGPCMLEIPAERELAKRFQGRPFALLGVNVDYKVEAARKAILDEKITWPNWYDGDASQRPITDSYKILGFPALFVLDATGTIRARDVRGEETAKVVEALLKEQEAATAAGK